MRGGPTLFHRVSVGLGLVFLYAPIVLLVAYSFNASRLVTVWGGWSLRWYAALAGDGLMLDAVWVTLRVGLISASLATLLGLCAATALVRAGRFRGRALFSGMIYAPLVLPEVILGLSLLLVFVALGLPRGFWTVTLSHATVTLCYATVVIQARLSSFDMSLEEAARDLGASSATTLRRIVLPLTAPAILAAALTAFVLSLDEYAVASFVIGNSPTYPVYLFSQLRFAERLPLVIAVAAFLVAVTTVVVIAAELIRRRGDRRIALS